MDDQLLPVAESEVVFRRIHRHHFQSGLPIPIQPVAFRPNEGDTTGLSVFRARFLTPVETLANVSSDRRGDYYVAQLAVSDLLKLELSVAPDPVSDGPPGHAIIPELRWTAYQTNKSKMKEIQLSLARLASSAIVHIPK